MTFRQFDLALKRGLEEYGPAIVAGVVGALASQVLFGSPTILVQECHRPHVDDFPHWPTSNGYHLSHVPDDVVDTLLH